MRSDAPDRLIAAGWAAVRAHCVWTIVDLRNAGERGGCAWLPASTPVTALRGRLL